MTTSFRTPSGHRPLTTAVCQPSEAESNGFIANLVLLFTTFLEQNPHAFRIAAERRATLALHMWRPGDSGMTVGGLTVVRSSAPAIDAQVREHALASNRGIPDAVLIVTSCFLADAMMSEGRQLICTAVVETVTGAFGEFDFTVYLDKPGYELMASLDRIDWLSPHAPPPERAIGFYDCEEIIGSEALDLGTVRTERASPAFERAISQLAGLRRH